MRTGNPFPESAASRYRGRAGCRAARNNGDKVDAAAEHHSWWVPLVRGSITPPWQARNGASLALERGVIRGQVVDVHVAESLGERAHHRVVALAGLELLHRLLEFFMIHSRQRRRRAVAFARRAVATGAAAGLSLARLGVSGGPRVTDNRDQHTAQHPKQHPFHDLAPFPSCGEWPGGTMQS